MTIDAVSMDSLLDRVVVQSMAAEPRRKSPTWSKAEDDFLRSALGVLNEEEIASELGRSVTGVHLRWSRDLHLPAPSKAPSVITAHRAAIALGLDGHTVALWVDEGLIPGRLMAGKRQIRLIDRTSFMVWACAPKNWVYFDIAKVADRHLRGLLKLEKKRWGDEWWSTRRVADYHGVDVGDVKRYIQLGRIRAVRLDHSRCGRYTDRTWSNHFILRSEATRRTLKFIRHGDDGSTLTPAGKAWIRKALRRGMNAVDIAFTMKQKAGTVQAWIRRYFPEVKLPRGIAGWSKHRKSKRRRKTQ